MSKPETTYIRSVHTHLPLSLHREKNNNPFSMGTADVWYSGYMGDLWVEYKWLPSHPKNPINLTAGKHPALTPKQQKWLRERYDEGRNVAVIVGTPLGGIILTMRTWELDCFTPADTVMSRREVADWIAAQTVR